MSLADAIHQAVTVAKTNLGDLVVKGVQMKSLSKTYDTGSGQYITTFQNIDVECTPDKFTYQEMQGADYVNTDVKVIVFNPNNDLDISTGDKFIFAGTTFEIRRSEPTWVGGFKTIFTLVLRK